MQAVYLGDAVIVELLLDLRNADGGVAIDSAYRPNERHYTPLEIARLGSMYPGGPIRENFQQNPRIIEMITARLGPEEIQRLQQEEIRRLREDDNIHIHLEEDENIHIHLGEDENIHIVVPGLAGAGIFGVHFIDIDVPAPPREEQRFNANPQNTHTPEVERTVDLSILQLKTTYQNTPKPSFSDVQRDIESLIQSQIGGRLYTALQISDIRRGFSYVCNNPNSLHTQSNLTLPEILTLVWLGIHDQSKIPNDFPLSGDKDLFVATRKTALLDKFLAIATTYPGGGTSCLGGTRNLIVETLNKAHPDVCIAPTSEAVIDLGLEQAKRFVLDELLKLPIREQRAILRAWNDPDEGDEEEKTPATKFKERIKPRLVTDLNQKLGTILPQTFFTKLDEQYEYFPEPVVHKELALLCKKIRELPDTFPEDFLALKQVAKDTIIFCDSEENFDTQYAMLTSACDLKLSFFMHPEITEHCKMIKELQNGALDEVASLKAVVDALLKRTDITSKNVQIEFDKLKTQSGSLLQVVQDKECVRFIQSIRALPDDVFDEIKSLKTAADAFLKRTDITSENIQVEFNQLKAQSGSLVQIIQDKECVQFIQFVRALPDDAFDEIKSLKTAANTFLKRTDIISDNIQAKFTGLLRSLSSSRISFSCIAVLNDTHKSKAQRKLGVITAADLIIKSRDTSDIKITALKRIFDTIKDTVKNEDTKTQFNIFHKLYKPQSYQDTLLKSVKDAVLSVLNASHEVDRQSLSATAHEILNWHRAVSPHTLNAESSGHQRVTKHWKP